MILSKIFTFLKESNILIQVKTQLLQLIENEKEEVKKEVLEIVEANTANYETMVVDFIMKKIELPIFLKPFKGLVRKAIIKNLDKLISFIKDKIQNV